MPNLHFTSRDPRVIYSDLLSGGHVEIIRTCKAIHAESKDLVYQKGIYRVFASSIPAQAGVNVSVHQRSLIQNLDIKIVHTMSFEEPVLRSINALHY